jgi:Na+-driven multidrug efflux pump
MSTFALFSTFVGRSGEIALAANQIQVQLLSFSFMPMWGLTTAGSVLTGNWMGAARPEAAAAYGRQVYKLGLYYCLGLAAILIMLRHHVYRIFTPDPEVLAFGGVLAVLAAVFQIGDGLRMVGSGLLTGAGDTRPVMLLTMAVMWGVFLPGAWWTVVFRDGDVVTAWAVACFAYLIQGAVFWLRFRSNGWQKVRIFSAGA